jgi:hypothetical protein
MSTCTCETTEKIDPPTESQYNRDKLALALSIAPNIYPCRHCGWPVLQGYCCTYCHSRLPFGKCEDESI